MSILFDRKEIVDKTADALIRAATRFRDDQKIAYQKAIEAEKDETSKWILETILNNAEVAEQNKSPLCDDTGIPHLILEAGKQKQIDGTLIEAMQDGIALGLKKLPGRPMAIMGDDIPRLDQSGGLSPDPADLLSAPLMLIPTDENVLKLHIMMQGGGPEIRAKTYRVFHKHSIDIIIDEIVSWATEAAGLLGCTPGALAVGIGRSHYEASSLMLQAMAFGDFTKQDTLEETITQRVNDSKTGPLGLGGNTSLLATFLKVGPQRASGVRIVCMRFCCCMEPRTAYAEF